MKIALISILFPTIVSPAAAQPTMNRITIKGPGSWEVLCHVKGRMGDDTVVSLTSARSSFAGSDFSSVSCDTSAVGSGPLVVSIAGPTAACPFKGAAEGTCERTFKAGAASFTVHSKQR